MCVADRSPRSKPRPTHCRCCTLPSLDLHRELAREAGVSDLIHGCDYIHVYRDATPDRLNELGWRLRAEHGARLELLDSAALHEREPALADHYQQAVLICDQGFTANPSRLVRALADQFIASGGEYRQIEVRNLIANEGRLTAVETESASINAAALVIAAGAWSTRLTGLLGIDLPLQTERGYHVSISDAGIRIDNTIMEVERKFVATPMETGLRLAGTVELASVDAPPDYRRAEVILEQGRKMFPGLQTGQARHWMGRRPSLPDGLPVISQAPGYDNVYLAFGPRPYRYDWRTEYRSNHCRYGMWSAA